MLRATLATIFSLTATAAIAHPGHIAADGHGHDHLAIWIAAGVAGVVIATVTAIRRRAR